MLDITFLRRLRDVLGDGATGPHHLLTESGWTTEYIQSPDEYDHARWLLRLSSLYHLNVRKKTLAGATESADVDVEAELAALRLTDEVRAAFDRR